MKILRSRISFLLLLSIFHRRASSAFEKPYLCLQRRKQKMQLSKIDTEGRSASNVPTWCPEQQIYIGGVVPENAEVKSLIEKNDGFLRLFGYGSLCWNPGTGALAKPGVIGSLGRARGYKRCWAQRSTDHRGNPKFPGIVCTLLEDKEVYETRKMATNEIEEINQPTMTEGIIYLIPPDLVDECLAELDFREKGGYARDVIDVVEDKSGETHKALLYRGTPENPAFWPRALLDLPLAAGRVYSLLLLSQLHALSV